MVPDHFGPGLFWPGSFLTILGVGHFGLSRWVVLALGHFGHELFWPNFNMVGYKHGFIKWTEGHTDGWCQAR